MVKIKREDFMSLSYQGLAASLNVKKKWSFPVENPM